MAMDEGDLCPVLLLLKGDRIASNVAPSITRSADSFSTVPSIVNGVDCELIVHDLETIIVLVLLAFNFIPQRGMGVSLGFIPQFPYTVIFHSPSRQYNRIGCFPVLKKTLLCTGISTGNPRHLPLALLTTR